MSTPTDTLVDSVVDGAQRTQDAITASVTGALRTWADAVQTLTPGRTAVPDAQVFVDRWFEVAQTVLDTQKAFARTVVGAGTHAADVVTDRVAEEADKTASETKSATSAARAKS